MSTLIGIDLQSIDEVDSSIRRYGDRYITRLFSDDEIDECPSIGDRSTYFTTRFAAKEAMIKILNVRERVPSWKTIEVLDAQIGDARVELSGVAQQLAREARIETISVSISCNGEVVVATVLAETARDESESTGE